MKRVHTLALGIGLLVLVGAPALTARAQEPDVAGTQLTFNEAKAARTAGWLALSTTLTRTDGKPLSNQPVAFFLEVSFYGARQASLGSAITDATGEAVLLYQPAENGLQRISAYFLGDDAGGLAVAEAAGEIDVRTAVAPYHREPPPLALVREWLPMILVGLVLGTWTVLLASFLNTIRGVRGAALTPSTARRAPAQEPVPRDTSDEWEVPHRNSSSMESPSAASSTKTSPRKGEHP